MIDAAAREGARELGLRRVLGRVKSDNAASRRAFERAGFTTGGPPGTPVHEAAAPPAGALLFVRDLVAAPVVAIVQARMGSTRLPGKVLAEVGGRPLLAHMLDRVAHVGTIDAAWVATTDEQRDDPIAALAETSGHAVFRGPELDVLARFAGAAEAAGAATVVRLTADCPLITPDAIDLVVGALAASDADLATNAPPHGRTWPDGADAEAFTRAALERAHAEATDPADREHVTRWFHDHGRVEVVHHEPPLGDLRITVDTAEDLERVRRVIEARPPGGPQATLDDLLATL
jgi:spore coat polysaccharide biosynthesis protein SpsF